MPPYWFRQRWRVASAISRCFGDLGLVFSFGLELVGDSELADDLFGGVAASFHLWVLSCPVSGHSELSQGVDQPQGVRSSWLARVPDRARSVPWLRTSIESLLGIRSSFTPKDYSNPSQLFRERGSRCNRTSGGVPYSFRLSIGVNLSKMKHSLHSQRSAFLRRARYAISRLEETK